MRGLFQRLAQGHAAGVTVVTPNRRLAQTLRGEFDAEQAQRDLQVWETADVLPFNAFVERLWDDALYSEELSGLPLLLTPAQELTIWEDEVRGSKLADALLSVSGAAGQCREAWQLAHAWRLLFKMRAASAIALNEDALAFIEWAARYERVTREHHQIDSARLPDVLLPLLSSPALNKPKTVVMFGFETVTPQQQAFLDALAALSVEVIGMRADHVAAKSQRVEFTSNKEEVTAAARWARARLEAGGPGVRIGIVVPDLSQSRNLVQRIFAAVMRPAAGLPVASESDASAITVPVDVSLGLPLSDFPLVHDALLVLELACNELAFNDASRLIRSPFLAAAEQEMALRARLDFDLRQRCGVTVTLERLRRLMVMDNVPHAPRLLERFTRLSGVAKTDFAGMRTASQWAQSFAEAMRAVGFPGKRTLDSAEYQTLQKWHEVLAGVAALEWVAGKMPCTQALQRLRRLASETLFQPETPLMPVQVLGALESGGLRFDHLWVMGLTDDVWPLPARPNPFIPVRLQREADIPYADAAGSLERGRRLTQDWLVAAPEVVVSHARMREDSELAPSPLIAAIERVEFSALNIPEYDTLRAALHRTHRLETNNDDKGPQLAVTEPFSGGTAVFKDQAACAFRAFARHRLDSTALETPQPGLDAADRGTLLHGMLAEVWAVLGDKQKLETIDESELLLLLENCAASTVAKLQHWRPEALNERFAAAEQSRLMTMARDWLVIEKTRPDFRVTAIERKRPVSFGGVTVNAKLDRMDTLATGERVVLDYKTGACAVSAWLGARPDEPQLPMYALGAEDEVGAVAFAQLKAGDLRFKGLSKHEDLLPGVTLVTKDRSKLSKQYASWADVVRGWRTELEALGRGFAAGDARVNPKYGELTCQYCDQHSFCRVAEKNVSAAGEEAGDE